MSRIAAMGPAAERRVVVTGMGIVCPLGVGVAPVWRRLVEGGSGIGSIQSFDTSELTCKVAGQIPAGTRAEGGLDVSEFIPTKDQKKMDRFIQFAIAAGVEDSKVTPEASFIDDLGADSLDTVELVMAFEEAFSVEIPEDAAEKISTVKDAIDYIEKQKAA